LCKLSSDVNAARLLSRALLGYALAMDIFQFNRDAWDKQVEADNRWTQPVSSEVVEAARRDDWELVLTPHRAVPRAWYPPLKGARVLALASGGGQQGPILAAAGADVTVFDASPKQLAQDRWVADRDQLALETVEGDMADLSVFASDSFDLIFNPCSNCFAQSLEPIWRECHRVLKPGGVLLVGFVNPFAQLLDPELYEQGVAQLRFSMPFSDLDLTASEREKWFGADEPLEFAHSLEAQLAGQLAAGLQITDLFEDDWGGSEAIDRHIKSFIATRSIKS